MSKPRFNQILDDNDVERDAIHCPIIKVMATTQLARGSRLFLAKDGSEQWCAYRYNPENYGSKPCIAVVSPFLQKGAVEEGEFFYAWIEPESLQKLWHGWSHPILDRKTP